jgi:PAS domain S-box-containing protein
MASSKHPKTPAASAENAVVVPLRAVAPEDAGRRYDFERLRGELPQIVDALTDAVVVVDRQRRVVAANRRYLEAFGASRADLAGTVCSDSLHCPEHGARSAEGRCVACEVFEHKQPQKRLRSLTDVNGAPRRWEASFSPVLDAGGEVTHIVEVWRDISERSKLEAQLSHNERLAALGILAAGVGHEINNPLASVLAGVESLERWCQRSGLTRETHAEAHEILELLEREVRRCRETSDKLMLLAQPISQGPGWVDLNRALRDTLALLGYLIRKHRIQVVEALAADLPALWGRESALRSVCMNLCLNAVQAMEEGGTLTLRTATDGVRITLEVADSGPGIASEHLERIWDPFFTTKAVGEGTGLGLSITHRIVVQHGGVIRVTSHPGEGAHFVVELPIAGRGGSDV